MQIVRPDRLAKGFSEAVKEIEDQGFLDLDLFLRLSRRGSAILRAAVTISRSSDSDDQPENKKGRMAKQARLLRLGFACEVLF